MDSGFGANDLRDPAIKFAQFYASRARWSKAAALLETVIDIDRQKSKDDSFNTVHIICQLGDIYTNDGHCAEVRKLLDPVLKEDSLQYRNGKLKATVAMASLCTKTDQLPQACDLYEEATKKVRNNTEQDEFDEVEILGNLARVYRYMGRHDEARFHYEQALQKAGNSISLSTIRVKFGRADLDRSRSKYSDALKLYSQSVEGFQELLGPDHPETVGALVNVAIAHRDLEQWRQAEETFWLAITHFERVLGENHVDTIRAKMNLAIVYDRCGQTKAAHEMYVQVLHGREKKPGLQHSYTLRTVERLATTMLLLGKDLEAEQLSLRTLAAGNKTTELEVAGWANNPRRLLALERLYVLAVEREKRKLDAGHVDLREAEESLAEVRSRQERDEAKGEAAVTGSRGEDSSSFHSAVDVR